MNPIPDPVSVSVPIDFSQKYLLVLPFYITAALTPIFKAVWGCIIMILENSIFLLEVAMKTILLSSVYLMCGCFTEFFRSHLLGFLQLSI